MKILQLAPRFPFPPDDGGKISIANTTIEFKRAGHEVTLFFFTENEIEEKKLALAKEYAEVKYMLHSTRNTPARILKSVLNGKSIYIGKHSTPEVFKNFRKLFEGRKFDAIHADHTCMAPLAQYARSFLKAPMGLRLHNVEWMIWNRYAEALKWHNPRKYYVYQQSIALKKAEGELIAKSDVSFAITETDKNRALELAPNANVISAPGGVNLEEWKPDDVVERNPYELVLATTYVWVHNVDAVRWFCENVLPIINKAIPEIKLTLIGKNQPDFLNNFKDIGADPIGYVDEVQPYYNRSAINVVPLFVGSGIRIKILEAMAMKLPVVASPVAAEGIPGNDANGLLIRDSAKDFADAIIELCLDSRKRQKMGDEARNFIKVNFTWSKNIGLMLKEYKKLIK